MSTINPLKYTEYEANIFGIYKPAGYTPLQALELFRTEQAMSRDLPLTYAGRLDPMAEGLLIVLAGEAVHRKEGFLKLDKKYTVTALLGVETDSFDLLGMPKQIMPPLTSPILGEGQIQHLLPSYVGDITLPLPLYSSPPVDGKPLFAHAQQHTMEAHEAPMRTTHVFSCELKNMGALDAHIVTEYMRATIATIDGEFRQEAILRAWGDLLSTISALHTFTLDIHCSSGTYIRSLVNTLGVELGTGASVYSLVRTQVGNFKL